MSGKLKDALGRLPLSAEAYWALRGRRKAWSAHYQLEGLRKVLPQAAAEALELRKDNPAAKKICVFATLHYWIEQAGLVALALAGQGHHVQLGYLPYAEWDKEINAFDLRRQDLYTRDVLRPAEQLMDIVPLLGQVKLRAAEASLPMDLREMAAAVADYDTQYTLQVEETDFESPLFKLRLQRDTAAAEAIDAWFRREKPDLVIVPNGTILEMGVAYQAAKRLGIKTVTFEFADQRERIWIAQDGEIMSHDTRALWQQLGSRPLPEAARQAMVDLFAARKQARLWGDFARQWQQAGARGGTEVKTTLGLDGRPIVLLATNVLGDSLTLGRQRVSATMADMIVGTIGWFMDHAEAQLVIRVHPGELKTHGTSMIDVINQAFPQLPGHIHVIRPEDKVNTYDLVEAADLGVVYTTTVGLEMAMAGLPVIVTGKTHYANKGFTLDPATWQEFEQTLARVVADPQAARLSPAQVEQAWLYAYLFFFEFSLPFPWHLVWLAEDFESRPMRYVLSEEGQARYAQTFGYLAGEPLDWAARGLARLDELNKMEEPRDA